MPVKKIQNKTETQDTVKSTLLKNSKFKSDIFENKYFTFLIKKRQLTNCFQSRNNFKTIPKSFS